MKMLKPSYVLGVVISLNCRNPKNSTFRININPI
jgi:hypothetical protein